MKDYVIVNSFSDIHTGEMYETNKTYPFSDERVEEIKATEKLIKYQLIKLADGTAPTTETDKTEEVEETEPTTETDKTEEAEGTEPTTETDKTEVVEETKKTKKK